MSDATLPSSAPNAAAPARQTRSTDALVFVAVSLVAVAAGLASMVHLGLPLPIALAIGLALHLILFLGHLRLSQLSAAPRARRASEAPVERRSPRTPKAQRAPRPAASAEPVAPVEHPAAAPQPVAPRPPQTEPAEPDLSAVDFHRLGERPVEAPVVSPQPAEEPIVSAPPAANAAAFDEILRDLARTIEKQVRPEAETIETIAAATRAARPPIADPKPAQTPQEQAITQSVAALRAVGEAMQSFEQKAEQRGVAQAVSRSQVVQKPSARTPNQVVLEEIADAIAAERVELALAPILGLTGQAPHHSELLMRLDTPSGGIVIPEGIAGVARGTNLVPLLDALKVGRAVRVAQVLDLAGDQRSIFCRITGEGMMSKRVTRALAGDPGKPVPAANRVLPCFLHQEVRAFGHAHWTTLADLSDQGFRFCLADLQDLDLEWQLLRNVGFAFARIEASVLLGGLTFQGTLVPGSEVGRFLAAAGLTLIADHIDHERLVAPIHAYGVPYGQGALLGEPRPIAADGGRVAA